MSEPKKYHKPSLLLRVLAVLGTTLGILCLFVYAGVNIICKGPSPTARDLFVGSVMETSAAKFLAYLCYSEEEIAEIRARNAVVETAEVTEQTGFAQRDESVPKDTIELADVTGPTFKGKMLIVHDPARVKVAVAPVFSEEASGVRVEDFAKQENAVAAINGGGFMDEGGVGKGGMPLGIVIKDGKLLNGGLSSAHCGLRSEQPARSGHHDRSGVPGPGHPGRGFLWPHLYCQRQGHGGRRFGRRTQSPHRPGTAGRWRCVHAGH